MNLQCTGPPVVFVNKEFFFYNIQRTIDQIHYGCGCQFKCNVLFSILLKFSLAVRLKGITKVIE